MLTIRDGTTLPSPPRRAARRRARAGAVRTTSRRTCRHAAFPAARLRRACRLPAGGYWFKKILGLILPGNILGLFILLALLLTGVIPLKWVEAAARLLLWLLPFLFLPIFILAMKDHAFWAVQGRALSGAVVIGTLLLWAFVGHLAQWLLGRSKD